VVERCRKWIEKHARRRDLIWSVLRNSGLYQLKALAFQEYVGFVILVVFISYIM
jgi:hypothetical protein